jgi:hypothetical protein
MRTKTLLIGSVLTIIGVYLIFGGASLVQDLAIATATSSVKTEVQKPIALTVDANKFEQKNIPFSIDDLRFAQISYKSNNGDIDFYIMDHTEFEAWKSNKTTTIQFAALSETTGNFTFNPDHNGEYHFIFDNVGSNVAKRVVLNISKEIVVTEINPSIAYVPLGLTIVGIVVIGFGLEGKKKPSAKNRNTLERMAMNLGIDPKGLTDKELRKEIQEKIET